MLTFEKQHSIISSVEAKKAHWKVNNISFRDQAVQLEITSTKKINLEIKWVKNSSE